jgi:hypothetical protein
MAPLPSLALELAPRFALPAITPELGNSELPGVGVMPEYLPGGQSCGDFAAL